MTNQELSINKVMWLALGLALASFPHLATLADLDSNITCQFITGPYLYPTPLTLVLVE